ncbi:SAM-dependent methyltransferase [Orrella sp. 11846]|uniref:SAM-dependent methyltransferase n=1 Tax=Orrella sp. 11846 TaxID=3409913 RepID=UPI003B5B425C
MTMNPAVSRWNDRFLSTDDYVFGTKPNQFMAKQAAQHLKPGQRVLAVADGEGRNGVWLAEQGFDTWSVDAAPAATEKARKLAKERGVTLHIETADLSNWNWSEHEFDAVIAIFIQFAGPTLRDTLFEGMKQALKPGGLMILQGYGLKQLEYRTGGPSTPENLYTKELLETAFSDMDILMLEEYDAVLDEGEGHRGMSSLVDLIARKR